LFFDPIRQSLNVFDGIAALFFVIGVHKFFAEARRAANACVKNGQPRIIGRGAIYARRKPRSEICF
jgi:hypothetical protein